MQFFQLLLSRVTPGNFESTIQVIIKQTLCKLEWVTKMQKYRVKLINTGHKLKLVVQLLKMILNAFSQISINLSLYSYSITWIVVLLSIGLEWVTKMKSSCEVFLFSSRFFLADASVNQICEVTRKVLSAFLEVYVT